MGLSGSWNDYLLWGYNNLGGEKMAKRGMKRIDPSNPKKTQGNHKMNLPKNDVAPVPEIQGKEKHGK